MKFKANHLANLADARFAAAAGADVLTFNFDRTRDFFISEELFKQMAEWLSVPVLALDFGNDREYYSRLGAETGLAVERAADDDDRLPGRACDWKVGEREGKIIWLEYRPENPGEIRYALEAARQRFPQAELFFNLDAFPELLPHSELPLAGVAGRKIFSLDPLHLDYDAFEAVFSVWKPDG